MRALNILELRDTDEIGGPGKTILESARAMDPDRFRVHVGVFRTSREGVDTPFTVAAREFGLPVHAIYGHNQYDPRLILRTAGLIRRLGIDIVHAHEVKSDVIALLASGLHRVPLVTTLHGWIGNSPRQRALIAVDKRVVAAFDLVIAVSGLIAEEARDAGVPAHRVRLLSNAIVLDRYRRSAPSGDLGLMIGRPLRGPVLTTIGRLSAEKGHADLIDALGLLAARGVHAETVIVGDGPERQALESQVDTLGLKEWVHFTGYLDRPQTVLNESSLLVLPSHTEGMPNVALEALAMGVPVLATRVGGTPEVIIDGDTGRLVPPRDPGSMAAAIGAFLSDDTPWRAMAERGGRHVRDNFEFQSRTRKLERMYLELLGDGQ